MKKGSLKIILLIYKINILLLIYMCVSLCVCVIRSYCNRNPASATNYLHRRRRRHFTIGTSAYNSKSRFMNKCIYIIDYFIQRTFKEVIHTTKVIKEKRRERPSTYLIELLPSRSSIFPNGFLNIQIRYRRKCR